MILSNSNGSLIFVTFVLFILIIITRFLPFWMKRFFERSVLLRNVGALLPGVIMLLLTLHLMKDLDFSESPYGFPECATILIALLIYFWRRNLLMAFLPSVLLYLFWVNI